MTKFAHITSRPRHSVGDRVLGLCGKEFKVKQLWSDIPVEKPICRGCVDVALTAMTEADQVIAIARVRASMLEGRVIGLVNVLNPEDDMILDLINENDLAHRAEQDQKAREKADAEAITKTCICVWETPETFVVNPECPIHGPAKAEELIEEVGAIGVEDVALPEEDQE